MFKIILITLGAALAVAAPATAQEPPVEWGYEGAIGPAYWGSLSPAFAACGEGSLQSPLDLRSAARLPAPRIDTRYVPSSVTLTNNGETVEVRSDMAQSLRVGGKSYSLVQLHFHVPSEHLVAGDGAPAEIHFVHQAADGERAVLGALVRRGRANRQFGRIAAALPEGAGEQARVQAPVDLTRLLPRSRRAYRYPGSLTTPPCTEGIRWMVMAHPVRVSEAQLGALEDVVEGNARPVQPRNDRPIVLF